MFMLIASLPAIIMAWALGGRFSKLADIQLRHLWLIWAALGLQLVLFTPLGHGLSENTLRVGQLTSYVPIIAFLFMNRASGLGVVATGVLANFVAIAANRGVMPASLDAQEVIFGPRAVAGQNLNTDSSAEHLVWLGDVMAVPTWAPYANAFSVGDLIIAIGLVWALARLTLVPESAPRGIRAVVADAGRKIGGVVTIYANPFANRDGGAPDAASPLRYIAACVGMLAGGIAIGAGPGAYAGLVGGVVPFGLALAIGLTIGTVMAASVRSDHRLRAAGVSLIFAGLSAVMIGVAPVAPAVLGAGVTLGCALGSAGWWMQRATGIRARALGLSALVIGAVIGAVGGIGVVLWSAAGAFALLGLGMVVRALLVRRPVLVEVAA